MSAYIKHRTCSLLTELLCRFLCDGVCVHQALWWVLGLINVCSMAPTLRNLHSSQGLSIQDNPFPSLFFAHLNLTILHDLGQFPNPSRNLHQFKLSMRVPFFELHLHYLVVGYIVLFFCLLNRILNSL